MAYFKSLDTASRSKSLSLKQSDLTSLPSEVIAIKGLTSLVLDENELVTLPDHIAQMKDLATLSVKSNRLASLPDSLSALVNLKELNLSENQLAQLPIGSMMQMRKLSLLNLEHNLLLTAPFELFQTTTLKKIRLAGNDNMTSPPPALINDESKSEALIAFLRLEAQALSSGKVVLINQLASSFPIEIIRLPVVTELVLSKNRIKMISDHIQHLTSMHKLSLDQNLLESLPAALGSCINVTEMRLSGNELFSLPEELSNLQQLNLLDLSKNQFQTLPMALRSCSRLMTLLANYNLITEISPWISSLSNLRSLQLASNQITALPFQVANLSKLHELVLEDNDVTFPPSAIFDAGLDSVRNYLQRLSEAPITKTVDFSGVAMSSFSCHPYMASFRITKMSLKQCGLKQIKPDISHLSALQELDVSQNMLAELPSTIRELSALKYLNADNNALKEITSAVGECRVLRTLSVANNQLTFLPPSLGFATSLKVLTVSGNSIVSPPDVYLRKRSMPWLLQYLRARHESQVSGSLNITSMSLSDIPADVLSQEKLLKLNLNCNDLRDVPKDLQRMVGLQSLSMTNNKLMRVPDAVCEMTWLQSLLLDDNMIKELPIAMNTLNGLRSLSLAHNALSSLPVKLNGLSSLRRLCLDGNTMGEVPRSIMQLTEIRILSMRDCGIAVLPEGITNLVALQELHMNDNTLEILPDLSPCADMRIMRFTNNRLQKLHMSVVGLMELRELSLMGNMMQRLPDDFTQLTKLEILHLDGQNFDSIPADITEQGGKRILEYIRKMALADTTATLDLSGMGVRQLPSAVMLILGLQHLFLHDNPIARIPPMIAQLTNLKTLTLNRTRVHSLPIDLPELYQLKKLELDLEQMMFPPLEVCELGLNAIFSYLRKFLNGAIVGSLDLSNSGMKEIPSDLSLSNGIKTLDLSNNRIARVPPELCLLTNLTVLNLDMNPLRPHVQDVVSHGLEALLKYLRSLYSGAQTGKLDVVQQNLKFYPDEILPEWHITWLRLDDNKIRHLPRKLGHLTDLTTFSVVNNQLEDLPETMVALNALSTLLIDHNEFTQIPSFVCKLSNLTELSATHNRLQSLSDEIGRLQRLQTMRVQGNPDLTHLPFTFGGMKNLRHLEFDTESMVSPDRQFQTDHASIMAYLQTLSDSMLSLSLDLSNRDLKAFPMDVLLLTGLTFLTIARNKIKTLPHNMCHHLSNLRMLDLESNQIENFPDSLGFARNLTCIMALGNSIAVLPNSLGLVHDHGMLLELDPDKITTPPGEVFSRGTSQALAYLRLLQDSVQTRTLSLSKWRLSTLPIEVTDLETLTELSITFNKMKVLPAAVGKLSQLTRLKASDNNLVALPPELAALTRLTDLDVSNNPLDAGFPPKSFLDRGIGTMLALFREVMVCKKIGILEIGHLALEELHLEASTLMDMHRLSLDRASSVHLHHFAFSADASQLTALKEISVCDAQLNFLPAFIPLCTMIQSLNLNNNRFSELPKEICWCLTMLTELRLNHNNIVEIADSISLLTDLRVLALVGNQLTFVNEVIAECCTKLEELHVSNNILTTLPQNLSRCHETLKILDLENNRMSKLPPVAVKLTQLTSLRLSGNPIEDLPLELGRLMYLSEITVPKSDLGNVPRDVVQAGGKAIIKYVCGINDCAGSGLLDLSNMNLHVLPPSIRDLSSSLTYLKLDENPLKRLPNWLGEMQLLSRISVRGTPMQRLPATLGAVASLEEVALDSDSPTLQSPPLEVVARGNSAILSYLRRSYSAVIHRQLDLSGFGLKQFPLMAISTPTTLTSLSLNDNHLEEVPGEVATITGLVMLSLSNNHISVLPAHMFTRMPLLKSLNVGGNPLERLPLTLGGLSKLEYLEFDASNDLTSPPRDITVKSVVAVVTYLKRVWAGRHSATLDLSGLDLTDVPLEVTTWAPFFAPPKIREVAEEEGAEEVLAMGREKKTVGGGEGGPAADVNQIQNGEDTGHGGDEEEEEEAVREAAYAVSDEAGREEQKEERVKALIAAPDMLAGEHAPLEVDRYHNLDDDDRSFEREEVCENGCLCLLARWHVYRYHGNTLETHARGVERSDVDATPLV
jgi:Leucine-rich repeat (LRR) protein